MRKLAAIILTVILITGVTAFSGCGGANDSTDFDGVTYIEKSGEMYVETKEGKERIKISFTKAGYGDEWIKQIGKDFLKTAGNENIYLVLDGDPSLTTAVSSKLEAGRNLSDIYMPLASNWMSYAALGYLEPLDDLYNTTIEGEDQTILDKITGNWKDYGKSFYNGEQHFYALPWNENITGIVYNETMFNQYGWQVPQTMAELKTLCDKIIADTDGTIAPFVYPGQIGGYFDFLGTAWWLQAAGIDGMNEFMAFEDPEVFNPAKPISMAKQEMLEAFESLFGYDVMAKYSLKGSMSKNHINAQISFANAEAAMIPNGNWIENESADVLKDSGIQIKMMRAPYLDSAKKDDENNFIPINYSATPDYIIVPKEAKNVVGAKKFLEYMSRDSVLKNYTKYTGCPRPFDYDISDIETSEFVRSCLDIWNTSESWFDYSTSPLFANGYAKKFLTRSPYTTIVYDETTAEIFCLAEYSVALNNWDEWQQKSGVE